MKRLLWLVLLGVLSACAVPMLAHAGDPNGSNPTEARKTKKHRHRKHHKNRHKGHITPDRYPQE